MVNDRLVWFIESKNLLSFYQAGYRKEYNSIDHIVDFEKYIYDTFLNHKHVIGIFFDLAKAHDTTWRFGILKRLSNWGMKGNFLRFLKSFLANPTFKVRIGSTLSDLLVQENGIL